MENKDIILLLIKELQKKDNTICYALEDLRDRGLFDLDKHMEVRQFIFSHKPLECENKPHWWEINGEGTIKRIGFLKNLILCM